MERERFEENTGKLWNFAKSRNPFECKDIKIALTEIRELQVCQQNIPSLNLKNVHILCNGTVSNAIALINPGP